MGRRALADDLYVLVHEDEDGKDCFTFWGAWNNRSIRWYKTEAQAQRSLDEILNDPHRGKDIPGNTRIVKFIMDESNARTTD